MGSLESFKPIKNKDYDGRPLGGETSKIYRLSLHESLESLDASLGTAEPENGLAAAAPASSGG